MLFDSTTEMVGVQSSFSNTTVLLSLKTEAGIRSLGSSIANHLSNLFLTVYGDSGLYTVGKICLQFCLKELHSELRT